MPGCASVHQKPVFTESEQAKAVNTPGIVICMNRDLAGVAEKIRPQPSVVVVVVYGDKVYGQQQVLPGGCRGPISDWLFLEVLKKRYPDRVIYLAVFDMPKSA